MKISKDDALHVAELARLEFNEDELEKLTGQLGNILEYIEKLKELDTTSVKPTYHILDLSTPFRDDKAMEWLTPDDILENAPERQDEFFTVPKVIEG